MAARVPSAGEPWFLSAEDPRPVARKLTVDGLDFLFPPALRDHHG
jgi:hypothetical protein